MSKTFEFPLTEPLATNRGEVSSLVIRRPKAGDLDAIETARQTGGDMGATFAMVAAVAGLSVEEVRELDAGDFMILAEKVAEVFPKPPAG